MLTLGHPFGPYLATQLRTALALLRSKFPWEPLTTVLDVSVDANVNISTMGCTRTKEVKEASKKWDLREPVTKLPRDRFVSEISRHPCMTRERFRTTYGFHFEDAKP